MIKTIMAKTKKNACWFNPDHSDYLQCSLSSFLFNSRPVTSTTRKLDFTASGKTRVCDF